MGRLGILDQAWNRLAQNERLIQALVPLVRGYVRHFPLAAGKRTFWTRVVNPYFAWHSFEFVAPSVFGARLAGNTIELLQQYIYYFGIWEPQLTRWLTRSLAPGDTFVDVGANIGYFSLLASKLVGDKGRVVAIEASPRTFRALQKNLERNGARNVRALNMAASDQRGTVKIFRGPETHIGLSTILESEALKRGCELEGVVDAAPLEEILLREEIDTARVIKIDVEGAEWTVGLGMRSLLRSGRRDLEVMVEIDPACLAGYGKRPDEFLKLFLETGFQVYELENDYRGVSYLPPFQEKRPSRLRQPIETQTDAIFSRQNVDAI